MFMFLVSFAIYNTPYITMTVVLCYMCVRIHMRHTWVIFNSLVSCLLCYNSNKMHIVKA
jgi:hypothetical protein